MDIRTKGGTPPRLAAMVLAGAALALAAHVPANAETLRLLSSWSEASEADFYPVDVFRRNVEEVSGGQISITASGPEVVPPFEQLQPVTRGVFDILYTHGVYHAGERGLSLAVDAVEHDVEERRAAGVWDFLDEYYQEIHGLKLLALVTRGTSGYHCYLRQPLSPEGDWQGRKIRGTASYHGLIRFLGGEPVVLPGGEVYAALERGVVDGACWPAAGMLAMKHYEVAKYRMEPTFGTANLIFVMNLDRWNRLSAEQQEQLLVAGLKTEFDSERIGDEILERERDELAQHGVEVTRLPTEKAERIEEEWRKSMWVLAKQCCGEAGARLHEIALEAGLTD